MTDPIALAKIALRREALARRDALSPDGRAAAAEILAHRPFPVPVPSGTVVSGFYPIRSEVNPLPLMRRLESAGACIALPVVIGRGKPLSLRRWRFGEPLKSGVWGIREPFPEAVETMPSVLLVPLLAFDRAGNRVGYGAGHYDMTLHRLRAFQPIVAIGMAFSVQEFDAVPVTERDARLDLVLTERETIDCRGA